MIGPDTDDRDRPPRRGADGPIDDERGQAYTLEGIIGAMILLSAVLMALNSAVLLPSTSGTIDRGVQSDVGQQGSDILRIAHEDGSLSETLRCWDDDSDESFYGSPSGPSVYNATEPMDNSLGTMLDETFSERFSAYKLDAHFRPNGSGSETSQEIVEYGASVRNSITVTHTVTLYEDQNLTESCNGGSDTGTELREAYTDHDYPIPPAADTDSPIYNVVEVRLTIIW